MLKILGYGTLSKAALYRDKGFLKTDLERFYDLLCLVGPYVDMTCSVLAGSKRSDTIKRHTAIECCQDPGLLWVEIDGFDTLTARKELALWTRNHVSIDTFDGPGLGVKILGMPGLGRAKTGPKQFCRLCRLEPQLRKFPQPQGILYK